MFKQSKTERGAEPMIYTITFNPALDYIVSVDNFRLGLTNRTSSEKLLAGGKGVNVSTVLKNLGMENIALGFTAGFTGEQIRKMLEKDGIRTDFIELKKGSSRINVKLRSIEGTEINGKGPDIDEESLKELCKKIQIFPDHGSQKSLPACYQSRAWKGSRFALIRAVLNLIAIILLAVIMDKTTSRKDAEEMLGLAEKQTENM